MAKYHTNTKSSAYLRDKEVFLKDLKQFNESRNIPYRTPVVNGVEIDLYIFYTSVQQRGGVYRINQNDIWDEFLPLLRLPYPCINGSTLLRKIYGTYLEKYEKAKGPPGRDDDNDPDEDPRRGRARDMMRVPFGGGTYISASGEALRTPVTRVASPSERLALSLLSPMPNEQDFAINVCTVLAADHSNRLPLSTTPHILDFLLAHAGVYNHASLRDTIGRSYYEARGRFPHEFWQLRAGGGGAKELADENKFTQHGSEQPELIVQALAAHNNLTDCLNQNGDDDVIEKLMIQQREISNRNDSVEDWDTEPEEDQLFAPELPGGATCVYTQRVMQIASIVRSLSFHEENVQYLAKNSTLVRFLLLCANCSVGTLRQSGLDALGNISTELIIKDPATCLISRHVLSTVQCALVASDRARVLAALELLNKLAQNEANEDALLNALEDKVYADMCSLLTLRDIMVLVCGLECVFCVSGLGERASEAVARAPGLLHTLLALLTVEAQSYGPRACILMRVVETVSGSAAVANEHSDRQTEERKAVQQPSVISTPTKQQSPPPLQQTPSTSQTPIAPASNIQHSHTQQRSVQENESFAMSWLRANYEPLPPSDNTSIDAADVYRQYVAFCTKLSRKGVIAMSHFPRLVRTVFGGTVGPSIVIKTTGESNQMYVGIRAKNAQNKPNQPAGPASPILKAQLTNKTGTVEVKQVQQQAQSPAQPHPHLSQALEGGASNTTLIKHLLAHKVSPAIQPTQVRQNQQRAPSTNTIVVQQNAAGMEVDPEAMIKCSTITLGGVASSTPAVEEKVVVNAGDEANLVTKEEPVQIQIDEQAQLTIKSAQNKMLADLLEKKSNPPVQVIQIAPQMNAPTIQITETGQIVQVKTDNNPVIQINEPGVISSPYYQVKNDQGQLIQIKTDQGQIIHLKDQMQGSLIQGALKTEKADPVMTDHSYTEPPAKRVKVEEEKKENTPQESVSKTAANLYAALAASALEDEEDLVPPKQEEAVPQPVLVSTPEGASVVIQEPLLQVQQPTMQVQQQTIQAQQPVQVNQMPQQMQVQQPMLQVQPMDVQNIIASQSGQIILQEKGITSQPTQFVQQPMQIIAAPGTSQGGLSYITQNLPGNMMQKTIIIVQGGTGGGPLTLTVNNPTGLDEATLNTLIAQATEAITQQQIIQNTGVIQSAQRVIVSQPTLVSSSQAITMVKTITQNTSQITPSQQPIITTQPQPHKPPLTTQQIVVTQKQPPALISTTNNQIIQGNQQLLAGNQQIIAVSNNQQIIVNASKSGVHRMVNQRQANVQAGVTQVSVVQSDKTSVIQMNAKPQPPGTIRQVIRQPVMVGNTKVGDKETIVNQPVVAEQKPAAPQTATVPVPKPSATPPPSTSGTEDTPWICHWRGCGKTFPDAADVFTHCARAHCPAGAGGEAACLWLDCDRVPRKTFALLNHLSDKHCSHQALKALYNSRRHAAAEAEANKPVSLGYPPNAAMAALNKHAADMFNPRELMDENEGPVTKSIRLTAALILRNIVIYSNTGRRILRSYESQLATIALSSVEASRTVAQVLYDMNNI